MVLPTTDQVALWGAVTGTLALAATAIQLFFTLRRHLFESPKLEIESVSAGLTTEQGYHFNSVTAFLLNAGAFNLSVRRYYLEVYEDYWRLWLRRPNRIIQGDGNKMKVESSRIVQYLRPTDTDVVPFSVAPGDTHRIDMNDSAIWPDRKWRRVYFVASYAPPKSKVRRELKAQPHCFADAVSLTETNRRVAEALAKISQQK